MKHDALYPVGNGEKAMIKKYRKFAALVAVFIFLSVSESSALTIVTRFIGKHVGIRQSDGHCEYSRAYVGIRV